MNIVWVVIFVLCAVIFLYANRITHKKHITTMYNMERKLLLIAYYHHEFKYLMESNISSNLKSALITFDDISDVTQKSDFIVKTMNESDFADLDKNDSTMASMYLSCMNRGVQYHALHHSQ